MGKTDLCVTGPTAIYRRCVVIIDAMGTKNISSLPAEATHRL